MGSLPPSAAAAAHAAVSPYYDYVVDVFLVEDVSYAGASSTTSTTDQTKASKHYYHYTMTTTTILQRLQ